MARQTCFELRAALRVCKLGQAEFARLCGTSANTVWRWCDGLVEIPRHIWVVVSILSGMSPAAVKRGQLATFKLEVEDVFPKGHSRAAYLKLVRRFHTDAGRGHREEIQLVNAMNDMAIQIAKMTGG